MATLKRQPARIPIPAGFVLAVIGPILVYLAAAIVFFVLDPVDSALFAAGEPDVAGGAIIVVERFPAQLGLEAIAIVIVDRIPLIPEIIAAGGHGWLD
jgi:hypothetical protein